MSELYSADDDHPLKATDFSFSNLKIAAQQNTPDQLSNELNSVAVDWQGLRNTIKCSCSTPFDQSNRKVSILYTYSI